MQKKNKCLIIGILIFIIYWILFIPIFPGKIKCAVAGEATTNTLNKLAVMIILDQINIEDLKGDYPNIHWLIEKGAVALMNIRTAKKYEPASGYLTIGSGTRAFAPSVGDNILDFNENYDGQKSGQVFENFTGIKVAVDNILILDIPKIISENRKQDYEIIPGLLGECLRKKGVPVTLLGNADSTKEKNRLGGLIAMDTQGIVSRGEVGPEVLMKDVRSPFFVKTNYASLYQKFLDYKGLGGLIILHLGDTIRANNYYDYVSKERYEYFRKKALKEADQFIGKISEKLDYSQDLLMVVTPFPSFTGYKERNLLTPFIIAGKGINSGYAISPTTRRSGIIANIDVAPTLLSFFNIPKPAVMLGHRVQVEQAKYAFSSLLKVNQQIVSTYVQRAYLIKPYVGMQIIVSIVFILLIIFKKKWLKYLRPLILAGMSVPLVFLILAKFASNELWSKYQWLLILTSLVVLIVMGFKSTLKSIVFISLVTAFGILIDLAWGASLMKISVLGYDPIGGSRYYGLGNEYMGVLIGSLVIGLMALLDELENKKIFRLSIILPLVVAFYLILSPSYGSNVGGTISAFGAFMTTLLLLFGIKFRLRHIGAIGAGIGISLAILFLVIAPHNPPSHISQTVELVRAGGIKSVFFIIGRKVSMNYKLFKYTIWTRGLLTSIGVIIALLYRPPYFLKRIFLKNPYLYNGFIGTGVGCLLALLFNDSGIVAAATMMIYTALSVSLLVIDEISG